MKDAPGRVVHLVEPEHPCRQPRGGPNRWGAGTIWQCGECGDRWEFFWNYAGHGWSRLTSGTACRITVEWCGQFIGRKYCSTHDRHWDGPEQECNEEQRTS